MVGGTAVTASRLPCRQEGRLAGWQAGWPGCMQHTMYLSCQHGISQSKHAILGHYVTVCLQGGARSSSTVVLSLVDATSSSISFRIYHWLKIAITIACLVFYGLVITNPSYLKPSGQPLLPNNISSLFDVSYMQLIPHLVRNKNWVFSGGHYCPND